MMPRKAGDCFMVAGKLVNQDDSLVLVHGRVWHEDTGRHWHAWVEKGETLNFDLPDGTPVKHTFWSCIDRSNGHDAELPAELFYKVGRVTDMHRYTADEARVLMVRTGHWGPWLGDV